MTRLPSIDRESPFGKRARRMMMALIVVGISSAMAQGVGTPPAATQAAAAASGGVQPQSPASASDGAPAPEVPATAASAPAQKTVEPPATVPPSVCAADRAEAEKAILSGSALPSGSAERRLVPAFPLIPTEGVVQLYLFGAYGKPPPGLSYRVFITSISDRSPVVLQLVRNDALSAQDAARAPAPANEQLKKDQSDKTLIQFISAPNLDALKRDDGSWWPSLRIPVRVTLIGCSAIDKPPELFGTTMSALSSVTHFRVLTILGCLALYVFAAFASFYVRVKQRARKLPAGWSDFKIGGSNPQKDTTGRSVTGTNYASFWAHLDPVVLTAGANGKGSPTKLQILFFTIVVVGVMSYILMLTGHLADLSTKILLLLGISGLGAAAAGGAEVAKNRLSFENYAWLEMNKWIPRGGIAEENRAEWKDIFTSDGEFDVSRFQMLAFSFIVAGALIGLAARLNDLASFDISDALLGLLGLSQALYVSGKLIAPPAIKDLDSKLSDLQNLEKALRTARDKAGLAGVAFVFGTSSPDVMAAASAYAAYKAAWNQARTMFESTLGRDVPDEAKNYCPPFTMAQVTDNEVIRLPDIKAGRSFVFPVVAAGGTGPYDWTLDDAKATAASLQFAANQGKAIKKAAASATDIVGTAPAIVGEYEFSVTVSDGSGMTKVRNFLFSAT